ncbi:hypothetical protein GCM10010455_25770 [Microbacterium esteraromaticum]
MERPAVDLDHKVGADEEVDRMPGELHLESQPHAPRAQPYMEYGLERRVGATARVLQAPARGCAAPGDLLQGVQADRLRADRGLPYRDRLIQREALRDIGEGIFDGGLEPPRP